MLNGVAVNKINNNKENNLFFVCKKIYYTKKRNTECGRMCHEKINSREPRVTLPKFYCSSGKTIKHNNTIINT